MKPNHADGQRCHRQRGDTNLRGVPQSALNAVGPAHGTARQNKIKIRSDLGGIGVAMRGLRRTRFGKQFIEFEQGLAFTRRPAFQVRGQIGEFTAVLAGRRFIKQPSQREQIGFLRARPFRRDEPLGSDKGARFLHGRHEANVRQLCLAIDEDHVRRLHVAMDESMPMHVT